MRTILVAIVLALCSCSTVQSQGAPYHFTLKADGAVTADANTNGLGLNSEAIGTVELVRVADTGNAVLWSYSYPAGAVVGLQLVRRDGKWTLERVGQSEACRLWPLAVPCPTVNPAAMVDVTADARKTLWTE